MELRGARDLDSRRAFPPSQHSGPYMDIPEYPVMHESYARPPVGRYNVPAAVTDRRYSPSEMRYAKDNSDAFCFKERLLMCFRFKLNFTATDIRLF